MPQPSDTRFRRFLRVARAALGDTQSEFAARIGVGGKAINRWEAGAQSPSADALRALADLANDTPEIADLYPSITAGTLLDWLDDDRDEVAA